MNSIKQSEHGILCFYIPQNKGSIKHYKRRQGEFKVKIKFRSLEKPDIDLLGEDKPILFKILNCPVENQSFIEAIKKIIIIRN